MSIEVREETSVKNLHISTKRKSRQRVVIAIAILVLVVLIGNYQVGANNIGEWRTSALQGQIAMTEVQLKQLVVAENLTVYWVGPMATALYTLDTTKANRSILTYLPQKLRSQKVIADSRVVGTYFAPNAFEDSLVAASKSGNASFKNANGNVVFFPRERTTGVFVALPDTKYQIEIFDPIPGQAISIASLRDQLTKIG